ncbi:MAG TPA: nitroreductase family protein [Holophaga sp.]|nr:nitroreductase family protein [Holophaga sp.]
MNVKEAIEGRRSIRKYRPDPVDRALVRELLEAGRLAPSGNNSQPWRFIVVEEAAQREALATASHDQRWMTTAPVHIAICADLGARSGAGGSFDEETAGMEAKRVIRDTAIAVDHMMLRAVELGLGTCWIGWYTQAGIRPLLGVPDHVFVLGILVVGYPGEDPGPRPRRPLDELVHRGRWGPPTAPERRRSQTLRAGSGMLEAWESGRQRARAQAGPRGHVDKENAMGSPFKALKVTDDIYWVGAIDWSVREFHGYRIERGTTYNAYLIMGEKITLVDTVKAPFKHELLSRIQSVVDPSKIDIIVSNHAEMDHSGCLPEVVAQTRPEKVYASPKGVEALHLHFGDGLTLEPAKEGDRLQISPEGAPGGPLSIQFMQTPFLHWPDSMFSYVPERKALFCQDAFGMHLASSERFAEELPEDLLREEASRYYANILMPYSHFINKLLDKVEASGLEIEVALPDHGPMWRTRFPWIASWYRQWASLKPTAKAVVAYDTMWHSTESMAMAIAEGLIRGGARVKVMPLSGSHRSDLATEVLEAGALIVGSPTLNNQVYPTVADALCYLKGLKRKNLVGAAFGSYGWSGESLRQIEEHLAAMGVELAGSLKAHYVPGQETLDQCRDLGERIGLRIAGGEGAGA